MISCLLTCKKAIHLIRYSCTGILQSLIQINKNGNHDIPILFTVCLILCFIPGILLKQITKAIAFLLFKPKTNQYEINFYVRRISIYNAYPLQLLIK